MGQVNVTVGGRAYALTCRDGEEARLQRLAETVNAKSVELQGALGQVTEPRLLLMSALLLADDYLDLRERAAKPGTEAAVATLTAAIERIDQIATTLEPSLFTA